MAPIVDLGTYVFKNLNTRKIKPEESFTEAYAKSVYESEYVHTETKKMRVIYMPSTKRQIYIR